MPSDTQCLLLALGDLDVADEAVEPTLAPGEIPACCLTKTSPTSGLTCSIPSKFSNCSGIDVPIPSDLFDLVCVIA